MELIKYDTEVIAKFQDENGNIYKIGLGADSLTKTNKELKQLALEKYNSIKFMEIDLLPPGYK